MNEKRLLNILNYFSKLNSPISIEDLKLFIDDFDVEKFKHASIYYKFGLISKNEMHIHEKLKYLKFNERMIELAFQIINYLQKYSGAILIFITGSLAYKNARPWEDVDLAIVSNRKNIIRTFLKILFLNRKLYWNKIKLKLCVNFVVSMEKFSEVINNLCSALVAFDLIKAIPSNPNLYYALIGNTYCVRKYFKTRSFGKSKVKYSSYSLIDLILFIVVFIYFKIINYIRNLRLLKKGQHLKLFNYDLNPDLYMIKSIKYEMLKKEFEKIFLDF
jgi:predicted nucleotidyltransferase